MLSASTWRQTATEMQWKVGEVKCKGMLHQATNVAIANSQGMSHDEWNSILFAWYCTNTRSCSLGTITSLRLYKLAVCSCLTAPGLAMWNYGSLVDCFSPLFTHVCSGVLFFCQNIPLTCCSLRSNSLWNIFAVVVWRTTGCGWVVYFGTSMVGWSKQKEDECKSMQWCAYWLVSWSTYHKSNMFSVTKIIN